MWYDLKKKSEKPLFILKLEKSCIVIFSIKIYVNDHFIFWNNTHKNIFFCGNIEHSEPMEMISWISQKWVS